MLAPTNRLGSGDILYTKWENGVPKFITDRIVVDGSIFKNILSESLRETNIKNILSESLGEFYSINFTNFTNVTNFTNSTSFADSTGFIGFDKFNILRGI